MCRGDQLSPPANLDLHGNRGICNDGGKQKFAVYMTKVSLTREVDTRPRCRALDLRPIGRAERQHWSRFEPRSDLRFQEAAPEVDVSHVR